MAADDVSRPQGHPGRGPEAPRLPAGGRLARELVIGAALAAYSWATASSAAFTTGALLIVVLPGAVIAVIAVWRPSNRIPPPGRMDVTGFSYWAIGVCPLLEWAGYADKGNSSWRPPALTDLINPLIAPHPLKSAAILICLLAGWALVRR